MKVATTPPTTTTPVRVSSVGFGNRKKKTITMTTATISKIIWRVSFLYLCAVQKDDVI